MAATNRAPKRDGRRGGFTLIELLVAASIVGILAGLAIPNVRTVLLRARAADAVADMQVVRIATQQYNADALTWPPEAALGTVPGVLTTYLPDDFSFSGDGYTLDFENWSLSGGLPGDPSTTTLIGVSVAADESDLGNAIANLLGSAVVFSVSNTHTIVIDRS